MEVSSLDKCRYILLHSKGYKQGAKKFATSILEHLSKGNQLSLKQLEVLDKIYVEVVEERAEITFEDCDATIADIY